MQFDLVLEGGTTTESEGLDTMWTENRALCDADNIIKMSVH